MRRDLRQSTLPSRRARTEHLNVVTSFLGVGYFSIAVRECNWDGPLIFWWGGVDNFQKKILHSKDCIKNCARGAMRKIEQALCTTCFKALFFLMIKNYHICKNFCSPKQSCTIWRWEKNFMPIENCPIPPPPLHATLPSKNNGLSLRHL